MMVTISLYIRHLKLVIGSLLKSKLICEMK